MSEDPLHVTSCLHEHVGDCSREFRSIDPTSLIRRWKGKRGFHDVPNVSSPFVFERVVVGSKEIPTSSAEVRPTLKRSSVIVGISVLGSLVRVPAERGQSNR